MVSVLFARSDSVYFSLGCDVYDIHRDARNFSGPSPVVAHPPCRAWGRLRTFAKPRHDEKDLAFFAVDCVRRFGGVLEHPASSTLWNAASLPSPGLRDSFGGFTFPILQSWFGHPAPKPTWLYICGLNPSDLPPIPFELGIPPGRVANLSRSAREHTPPLLASWLLSVAASAVGGVR